MVFRSSRLGRGSANSGSAIGLLLIFAGLVAAAVKSKRGQRQLGSMDEFDDDDLDVIEFGAQELDDLAPPLPTPPPALPTPPPAVVPTPVSPHAAPVPVESAPVIDLAGLAMDDEPMVALGLQDLDLAQADGFVETSSVAPTAAAPTSTVAASADLAQEQPASPDITTPLPTPDDVTPVESLLSEAATGPGATRTTFAPADEPPAGSTFEWPPGIEPPPGTESAPDIPAIEDDDPFRWPTESDLEPKRGAHDLLDASNADQSTPHIEVPDAAVASGPIAAASKVTEEPTAKAGSTGSRSDSNSFPGLTDFASEQVPVSSTPSPLHPFDDSPPTGSEQVAESPGDTSTAETVSAADITASIGEAVDPKVLADPAVEVTTPTNTDSPSAPTAATPSPGTPTSTSQADPVDPLDLPPVDLETPAESLAGLTPLETNTDRGPLGVPLDERASFVSRNPSKNPDVPNDFGHPHPHQQDAEPRPRAELPPAPETKSASLIAPPDDGMSIESKAAITDRLDPAELAARPRPAPPVRPHNRPPSARRRTTGERGRAGSPTGDRPAAEQQREGQPAPPVDSSAADVSSQTWSASDPPSGSALADSPQAWPPAGSPAADALAAAQPPLSDPPAVDDFSWPTPEALDPANHRDVGGESEPESESEPEPSGFRFKVPDTSPSALGAPVGSPEQAPANRIPTAPNPTAQPMGLQADPNRAAAHQTPSSPAEASPIPASPPGAPPAPAHQTPGDMARSAQARSALDPSSLDPTAPLIHQANQGSVEQAAHLRGQRDIVGPVAASGAAREAEGGLFYGWILVGAVFFILAITSGLGFYNASVILSAATGELGASVGAVSGATGLFFAISGLTGFIFAKKMNSVDLRWFFALGGLVGAIALVGLQWVDSIIELYIFFAVFGVGFSLAGLVPGTTLVTRWFDRRRAVALSVASTGLSFGGIAVTPMASWLIRDRGLAGASPYMAAIWIIGIIPVAFLLIRSFPAEKGLRPDGGRLDEPATSATGKPARDLESTTSGEPRIEPSESVGLDAIAAPVAPAQPVALEVPSGVSTGRGPDANSLAGLDFASARSSRFFVALCFAYAVIFFGQVGAIAQLYNMVVERTGSDSTATYAVSALAFSSVAARLVGGAMVNRLSTQFFTAALAVAQAAALVALAFAPSTGLLILSSVLFGISIGNLLMLQPLLLAEAFGVRNYGQIYGFNQLFGTLGVAGGPLGLGLLRDGFDYRVAFLVAACASLIGFAFILGAGPMSRVQDRWSAAVAA